MRLHRTRVIGLLLAGVLAGCATTPDIVVTAVTVNPTSVELVGIGTTGTLQAQALSAITVVAGATFEWSSNNAAVEVTPQGDGSTASIRAMQVGTATVSATSGGKTGQAVITVTVPQHSLSVVKAGNGSGTVTSNVAGISCGSDCSELYNQGAVVTLSAAASVGSTFTGWNGGGCTGAGNCVVTMTSATTVTATFALIPFDLTVAKAGNGSGTVTSNPAGINCGVDCSEPYNFNSVVTLTAAASVGSSFTGWAGGGCVGVGNCVVTVTAATAVTATFALIPFDLTVTKAGTGSGTVTSNLAGINCGVDCSEPYNFNTVVTLTPAPAVGSTFAGWAGGGCAGVGNCVVTVTAATTVTATFNIQLNLTVAKAGNGSGTVTSNPAGINCGVDCSEPYNPGAVITLTAVASVGSTFTGWAGGGCGGVGNCVVTMSAAITVTATFTLVPFNLTVAKAGTGSGTVTSIPAGINCGPDCTEPYNFNTVVTLTATEGIGSTVAAWTGEGCSANPCVVTMSQARNVTATFTANTGPAKVGYYRISTGEGGANQVAPITTAGHTAINMSNLTAVDLAGIEVLFIDNPSNSNYAGGGGEFIANQAAISEWVNAGGVMVFHDRYVTDAATVLPGGSTFNISRETGVAADVIDILDNTTLVTNGPGGIITNTSLDGGNSSSHGFARTAFLPVAAKRILMRADPNQIVTFSYCFGGGGVVYSTIPLDFYLGIGAGASAVAANMVGIYAPNVVAYGAHVQRNVC